jgi:hypothetical protein
MDAGWRMAYNPPRFWGPAMRRRHVMPRHILMGGATLLLVGAFTSCALVSPPGRVLYQQGRTVVQLETDPTVGGTSGQGWNTHPIVIKPQQMATLLRGVRIRSEQGFVGALLGLAVPAEAVFTDEEVALLAPVMADGLAQAGPAERVGFTLRSAQPGRRNAPLSGYMSVRDPYLKFGLNEHPTIGWEDPEDPSAPKLFELEFVREGFLRPASEEERKGTYKRRPLLQIDYRRYLAALTEPGSPTAKQAAPAGSSPAEAPASSASSAEAPRAGPPAGSQAVKSLELKVQALTEELARLREELAETKQLLADKVLELNRLKGKSGATSKGKPQADRSP